MHTSGSECKFAIGSNGTLSSEYVYAYAADKMTMTDRKYRTRLCPENCNYRNRLLPYCGYCLYKILKEMEEDENANRKNETEHTEQSD